MRTPTIGFVLNTHADVRQTLLLCKRLSAMFGDPPIALHHDFSQTALNKAMFPANVRFIERWLQTSWGSIAVVDAVAEAIRLLYEFADPDWFVSLSATDYPIQTAETILRELAASRVDLYLDSRRIFDPGGAFVNEKLGAESFRHPRFQQFAHRRYVAIPLLSGKAARRLRTPVEKWCLRSEALSKRLTPFDGTVECYAGDAWFTANRRTARFLLEETPLRHRLRRHYASRSVPEESFWHTMIGNEPSLRSSMDNKRFTDWTNCYAHPRTLGRDDFAALLASSHHFARKMKFDPEMLRDLDEAVAGKHGGTQEQREVADEVGV